jgi:hypothetical protein
MSYRCKYTPYIGGVYATPHKLCWGLKDVSYCDVNIIIAIDVHNNSRFAVLVMLPP